MVNTVESFMERLRAFHHAAKTSASARPPALRFADFCARNHGASESQFFQDLFVLFILGGRKGGYFVEFGACDGLYLSNTLLLERKFGWTGLLAEPARRYHEALRRNRGCAVDLRCVYSRSGETVSFRETAVEGLSTLTRLTGSDSLAKQREEGEDYSVETISLNDLLDLHNAPATIDYLSLDTEGSEYEILEAFDFSRRRISVITVEHNHTPSRRPIRAIVAQHDYVNFFPRLSEVDDWFVHRSVLRPGS